MLDDESEKTFLAVVVEPIIVISLGTLLFDKVVATISGSPHIIFTTPGGKFISLSIFPIIYADTGDSSDGFIIMLQPEARAGPILKARFNRGKFHAK